jgi:mono/diheme cytochrome c family protein
MVYKIAGSALLVLAVSNAAMAAAPVFPDQAQVCSFDASREQQRAASAQSFPQPVVQKLLVNGTQAWSSTTPNAVPALKPGDTVTLIGQGFGAGPDIDFSKLMIGNSRVLETDLKMYEQTVDLASQVNYEIPTTHSTWNKDIQSWTDTQIVFTVPVHASKGPLQLQIQKRIGYFTSLLNNALPQNIIDAQTYRIPTNQSFVYPCDIVSDLTPDTQAIAPIDVTVSNPDFPNLVQLGREIFWGYDFNLGLAHHIRHLDWPKILNYQTTDPITQQKADPAVLFGAYKTSAAEDPAEAYSDIAFNPYPQANPIPGFLAVGQQLLAGTTSSSGWVGYRYAEAIDPYSGKGKWIGFNCASCHGYRVSYQKGAQTITKVIPGLPNPGWSMKWSVLGTKRGPTTATFDGIVGYEPGPAWSSGSAKVDKTALIYVIPAGTGEHTIVRASDEGSLYDNDYQFSPIAIPNVTNYMAIRRSLSHTESYVGFEGSYIHSEEPDGSLGSMDADSLKALTAYMTTLDANDDDLRNAGLYRWLNANHLLAAQTGATPTEGAFVQAGWQSYGGVSAAVASGKTLFDRDCGSCHSDKLGANTNERMFRLDEVGRFFEPTVYQREMQSIRATFLRDEYWVQSRGLLSDGHVRNLEDLVNPDRCTEGTALYNQYYTLHAPVRPAPGSSDQPTPAPDLNRKGDVFRVYRGQSKFRNDTAAQRNRFIERHKYFVTVPWDSAYYYWDYQSMRKNYGPEMGAPGPIGLPAAPHPWCTRSGADISPLVEYVLTL